MAEGGFFVTALIYLAAAVIAVPIAKRVGLGSVLGYLIAGMAIGPFGLGLVGEEGQDVLHFAEFGVVMMLFLIGLELDPAVLWRLRTPILGLGGLQVLVTALAVAALSVALGFSVREGLALGLILALSSTAIVLQTLEERELTKTHAGESSFAVLLFQDVAVIFILAVLPLLASDAAGHHGSDHGGGHGSSWVEGLPAWAQTLAVLGAVGSVIVGGRFIMQPAFRYVAKARLREVFVAAALLLIVGIALLMQKVGLSPALGTFVAGVVLANSEYRHELESDIEPFKGLLLGLFFIAVGASIDFALIAGAPLTMAGLVVGLLALKFIVLYVLARVFRLGMDQRLLFALALAQGGEFAFVLFSFSVQNGVLGAAVSGRLVAAVALTMAATPVIISLFQRFVQPRVGTKEREDRPYDTMDEDAPVIIAGHGRFGQIVARLLESQSIPMTVLEYDSDQIELLRKFGRHSYYGDATRYDLLEAAGAAKARLLVLAIDRPEKTLEIVHTVKRHFPQLKIVARSRGRTDAYDLIDAGVDHVVRETFGSAVEAGTRALEQLGYRRHRAYLVARTFVRHDEQFVREVAATRHGAADFFSMIRNRREEVARTLRHDLSRGSDRVDASWDIEALRSEVLEGPLGAPTPAEDRPPRGSESNSPEPTSSRSDD